MQNKKREYFGEQTRRGIENFVIHRGELSAPAESETAGGCQNRLPREFIRSLAEVKEAVFRGIQEAEHRYPEPLFTTLMEVLEEIRVGAWDDQFPIPLSQGGAGTSIHMNFNEVVSAIIEERIGLPFHPLEEGARYQSTNDIIPTAVIVTVFRGLLMVEEETIRFQQILVEKERQWRGTLMVGRTEWQDALPIDASQVAAAWAGAIERDRWRLHKIKERLRVVPLGGTAVGTAFFVPKGYLFQAERFLRELTGLPLSRSQNLPDAVSNQDSLAEVASGYSLLALNVIKICNDLFFYTSSPVGEMCMPEAQWGSTIMPFKTNPVLIEFVKGLAIRVEGHCGVAHRYAEEGNLQLNAFLPFLLEELLLAAQELCSALATLSGKVFPTLELNQERIQRNLLGSPALLNALRDRVPYPVLKEVYEESRRERIREQTGALDRLVSRIAERTGVDKEELDTLLRKGVGTYDVERK